MTQVSHLFSLKLKLIKKLCEENGIKFLGIPVSKPLHPGTQTNIIIIIIIIIIIFFSFLLFMLLLFRVFISFSSSLLLSCKPFSNSLLTMAYITDTTTTTTTTTSTTTTTTTTTTISLRSNSAFISYSLTCSG